MTRTNIKRRLVLLEQSARSGTTCGCVFASIEDAERAGITGGVLIIAPMMTPEQFADVAPAQQQQLTGS